MSCDDENDNTDAFLSWKEQEKKYFRKFPLVWI